MRNKKVLTLLLSISISLMNTSLTYADDSLPVDTIGQNGKLTFIANYSVGTSNSDGGVAEIVKYNPDNQKMYIVNGAVQSVDIVSLSSVNSTEMTELTTDIRLDVASLGEEFGFNSGDITSVDVNPILDIVAIAVQDEDYSAGGSIVLLDYDGNYITHFQAGVQPDMVTFSPDGNYLLSADEGEPRNGYAIEGAVDPMGSVTFIDLTNGIEEATAQIIDFSDYDSQRDLLIADQVLLKTEAAPSVDLEPEYITISEDNKYAYVTLQEANAIATFDMANKAFISIKGLGFKDHNLETNALDVLDDEKAELSTQDLYGVYMPDGCATVNINGTQYILTANEGDSRDWGEGDNAYTDESTGVVTADETDYEIIVIDNASKDGLDADSQYLYGARSFSIWNAESLTQVFDSRSDFEKITADLYPEYFNSSNNKTKLDSRSPKKGPEPEGIASLTLGNSIYAFVGFERIGGVMMYDITDPNTAFFVDYLNLRDFNGSNESESGALGPEGLCVINGEDSPTGKPLLLVANEVSGTVNILEVQVTEDDSNSAEADSTDLTDAETLDESSAESEIPKTGEGEGLFLVTALGVTAFGMLLIKTKDNQKYRLF